MKRLTVFLASAALVVAACSDSATPLAIPAPPAVVSIGPSIAATGVAAVTLNATAITHP